MKEERDSGIPRLIAKAFAALIWLFPRRFREALGDDVLCYALDDLGRWRSVGRVRAAVAFLRTTTDLLTSAFKEHIRPSWQPRTSHHRSTPEPGVMFEQILKDLRHGARGLSRAPSFVVICVATLSLAIGANVAVFSVVRAVLIEPLPFHDPGQLVSVRSSAPGSDFPPEFGVPIGLLVHARDRSHLITEAGVVSSFGSTIRNEEFADRLRMAVFSASWLATLQVQPVLGRLPTDDDTDEVSVISHGLWMSRFGGDSSVVGRAVSIADRMRTVIGVMAPEFQLPEGDTDVWIPVPATEAQASQTGFNWGMTARLAPGVEIEEFTAELTTHAHELVERFGGSASYASFMELYRPIVRPLRDALVGDVASALWVLLGTMGIVLLIACANVANLFFVRAESRRGDMAVRQALGASRRRLMQVLLAEGLLLAFLAGIGGVVIAFVSVPLLVAAAPDSVPQLHRIGLGFSEVAYTAALAIVAVLFFGLVPAIRTSSVGLARVFSAVGRSGRLGAKSRLGRDALVVGQTALALVLLIGSGLLVRSFMALRSVDPGYDIRDVFTFQIAPSGEWPDAQTIARFHFAFMDRLRAVAGVQSVGVVNNLPLDESVPSTRFATETTVDVENAPLIPYTYTGGDYFETMNIDIVLGRTFRLADHGAELGNAVVSVATADILWPGQNPIGKRFRFAGDSTNWETVVGVVGDVRQDNFRESADPKIYLPLVGRPPRSWGAHSPAYVVKSTRAASLAADVRSLVREVDPGAPMYAVHTMESLAADSMVRLSFTMLTIAIASGLALVLGSVGLYGVLSYIVSQRTREIGLRMALGAPVEKVRWMVVRQGGRLTLIGVLIGVVGGVGVTRVLGTLLYGVHALDATTFAVTSSSMLLVGILASYLPARRASSVDPLESLRAE